NDVLLTALTRALARWTGQTGLLVDLEGHGREGIFADVDLSRTVGWVVAIYPAWLEVPSGASPAEAVQAVRAHLSGVPRHGIGYRVLRYLDTDSDVAAKLRSAAQAQISFNYVGQFDALPLVAALAPAHRSVGHVHSAPGRRRYVLEFHGHVANGQLQAGFTYSRELHERVTVERLAQEFLASLRWLLDAAPASGTT